MEILTRKQCAECDGSGIIAHHAWVEFYHADTLYGYEHNGDLMSPEQLNEWFRKRGYNKLPKEEIICSECEGKGNIEEWMNINQALEKANIVG